ncbi:YppE family protein [Aquibacillus koreensis]|uniref:YppE family protein n=1 Tax=Aquibacillus koreensis TaxID=279446 RepID=A0A9X3WI24_9BACI|nr:YppE family protein [Aquibacillus koreensis]MCT2537345.1 YppE family protein [Aquibacillus koreensis]MDC3418791.1 YppE family protein [Aquibacillus koreensis]
MDLHHVTSNLKITLEQLKEHYLTHEKPEKKKDMDFFLYVKDKTSPTFELLKEWEAEALVFAKDRSVQVHPNQITSTKENMELLLMHSYYVDVNRKRYMNLNKSVHYVFDLLLQDIHK